MNKENYNLDNYSELYKNRKITSHDFFLNDSSSNNNSDNLKFYKKNESITNNPIYEVSQEEKDSQLINIKNTDGSDNFEEGI